MPEPAAPRRRALAWGLSFLGAALLLWLASGQVPLWPDVFHLPRPGLLALAALLHLPYSLARAGRLRHALPPGVPVSSDLLYGSGLVSALVIMLLPLRLGELSRPLILARAGVPGLGLAEAVAAIASERLLDGLLIVAMLFLGLALSGTYSPELADAARHLGLLSGAAFGALALALALLGLAPGAWIARLAVPMRVLLGARLAEFFLHLARALRPLLTTTRGLRLVAASIFYWGLTVLQLWLVLGACGLALGPAEASAIVALIGLSIQLPGGPAQTGSFHLGAALALQLFLPGAALAGPGASFGLVMYLLGLLGAALVALVGLALLARDRRARPAAIPS